MIPLSPALFLAGASCLIATHDPSVRPKAPGDPLVRDQDSRLDATRSAAFIAHVGYWSHRAAGHSSHWPFPLDASCATLARLAQDRGVLRETGAPELGMIHLRWSPEAERFTRASIVVSAADPRRLSDGCWAYDCLVVEGSALRSYGNQPGQHGALTTRVEWARRTRIWNVSALGDRLIAWVELDERNQTTRTGETGRAA